jgi:putative transcriptional regulator
LILFQLVALPKKIRRLNFPLMAKQKRRYNRIKIVLIEKEKTNMWLAEKLGLSKGAVSRWCTNDNQPTVENLFKIADLLDVEVSELLISNRKR